MKIQVTFDFISKYKNAETVHEAAELHQKVAQWTETFRRENNYLGKHMGQWMNVEVVDVTALTYPNMVHGGPDEESPF